MLPSARVATVFCTAVLLGLTLAVSRGAWAEDPPGPVGQEVEGAGEAPVLAGNIVSARRRALDRARQDALAQAVASQVPADKLAGQESLLRGAVYKRHRQYIRRYRILEESQDGKVFRLRVAVTLDAKRLLIDLRRLLKLAPASGVPTGTRPTVCLALQGEALAGVKAALGAAGFAHRRAGGGPGRCSATLSGGVSAEEAPGVRGVGLPGARATAQLRLVLEDGTVLAEQRAQAVGVADSAGAAQQMARRRALERAMAQVVRALERQWPRGPSAAGQGLLRVSGVTSLQQHDAIREYLARRVPGVRQVTTRRLERGEVWFAVSGSSPSELVKALASHEFESSLSPHPSQQTPFRLQLKNDSGGTLWFAVTR